MDASAAVAGGIVSTTWRSCGERSHAKLVRMSAKTFLVSRWRGEVPLNTVFWRDMIVAGTMLNVIAAFSALLLLAAEVPTSAVLAVYFLPLPWNIFLFLSVWRSADRAGPSEALMARIGAFIWFVLAAAL